MVRLTPYSEVHVTIGHLVDIFKEVQPFSLVSANAAAYVLFVNTENDKEAWEGYKQADYIDFMKKNYRPDWTYADFAQDFTAEFYDANTRAELFADSVAKYIEFVSKHNEEFCNWPTNVSFNSNSQMVGPKRDFVGELAWAIRSKTDLHFGLYHSLFEWFHPLYLQDKANFTTTRCV